MPSRPNRHQRRAAKPSRRDPVKTSEIESSPARPSSLLSEYFEPPELAAELNVCEKTLDRWRRLGKGPPITKIGRKPYYSKTGVVMWLRGREQRSLGRAAVFEGQSTAA